MALVNKYAIDERYNSIKELIPNWHFQRLAFKG